MPRSRVIVSCPPHTLPLRVELNGHLAELERANLLRPASAEVWEWTLVERDIVYEVLPHYQRRRLHAQLAQVMRRVWVLIVRLF